MKPAPFEYLRAASLEDACLLLATHGPDAKLIAGGQSLVPMMAMRLVRPAWLIDVGEVAALAQISIEPGGVTLGACVRQHAMAEHGALGTALPIIGQALAWVGHEQTRNRGTLGGSLVHADPSAELPLVAVMLDARLQLHSAERGVRTVSAREFFTGPMSTAIEADECLAEVRLDRWSGDGVGSAFDEVAIRHGDFALASACAQVALDRGGRCVRVALALGGVAGTPLDCSAQAASLVGQPIDDAAIETLARAVSSGLEPPGDLHASPEYRRALALTLCARVLRTATARARQSLTEVA
jgi:CO/xanthine dehydrogenase FAD-binding subunit